MKKVFFVTYGSGHVKMVLPVAKALETAGIAQVAVLALTTAASVVREAGLNMVQFKTFVGPGDALALEHGKKLMADMHGSVLDQDETVAYLGLCFSDLVAAIGEDQAKASYRLMGRQAFCPCVHLSGY